MMKKIYTVITSILIVISVFAQVPQKMSYQAIIRNSYNVLVTNKKVSMKISILQNQTPVYVEMQTTTSNENGLITLEIGNGIATSGTFSAIKWGTGAFYIKTETDPDGGTYYSIVGTSELLSVPYALYSTASGSAVSNIDDAVISPTSTWSSFKINSLIGYTGNPVTLATVATTGKFSDLLGKPTTLAGYGITDGGTGTGTLITMSGDATMTPAGVVTISPDAITTTKIKDGTIADADLNKTAIPLSGFGVPVANVLMGGMKITNLGLPVNNKDAATKKYVDDAIIAGTSTAGGILSLDSNQNLSLKGGNAVSLADLYQSLSLAGTILSISGPRDSHVDLAAIAGASGGSGTGGVVLHDASLTGNGTSSNVLGIATQGITPTKMSGISTNGNYGQVLSSNGGGSFIWTDPGTGSGGGLTSVNVIPSGGITASVSNILPTATLSLGLGAITPTSITTSGTINTTGSINGGNITGTTLNGSLNASNLTGTLSAGLYGTGTIPGTAIAGSGTAGTYLRGDGTWATPAAGGITNVSVTTNAGVSGIVTNPTTTPAIALTLGNITPVSVNTGLITATGLQLTTGATNGYILKSDVAGNATWAAPTAGGISTVSVTTNAGVSGVVTNPTTAPAIELTLGAITPVSVSTSKLQLTTGASNGYVLKSDLAGNASWQSASSSYKGMWNATTNTPPLANGSGSNGDYYIVSVAGTQLTQAFIQGGQAVYNGSTSSWESISAVESDPMVKAINGMVKSNGTVITAAIPGTDYMLPSGNAANVTGIVAIANGGTNATNASEALTNLGAAALNSPTLTGVPTAPTATVGTNNTQLATTAFVLANAGSVSIADGSIVDAKLQAAGGGALLPGTTGQVLASAGGNQFKWTTPGTTPTGNVLPGVAPAGASFYNTSTHTYWVSDGTTWIPVGTATSVGLVLPSFMTVSNSPVTTTGVLTGTLNTQTQGTFFAAPSGATGTPTFRTIQDVDIPSLANKIDISSKGAALGVAPLDASQKVPATFLPDAILGSVTYKGIYNANTGIPALTAASALNKGYYYVVNVVGSTPMNLGLGDWVISNGTSWEKVSNSGAVPSVFGRSGAVVATSGDYTSDQVTEGVINKYYTNTLANLNPTLIGKEDLANKVNAIVADASFTKYPTVDAVKNYVDAKVPAGGNAGQVLTITGGVPTWSPGGISTVSVVTANGVSGTVDNSTSIPAITLSLGAITPSSINTGTVTAATLIGNLDAAKLTGSIPAGRYAANSIPVGAINATGSVAAGYFLDALGNWSIPSGGPNTLPSISTPGDANKVLTVNVLGTSATWVTPGSVSVPDAAFTTKGSLKLAGDLRGTADSPIVLSVGGSLPDVAATANTIVLRDGLGGMTGNISGNAATATTATTAGTVTASSQPAITSVGVLANLKVTSIIDGNINGNAASANTANTATTATTATNATVTDISAGAIMYPTFVNGVGNKPLSINMSNLSYAPATGTLTATTFNGNLDAGKLNAGTIPALRYGSNSIPVASINAGTVNTNAFLKGDGTWAVPTAGSGTVTSVGLTLPTIFTVTNPTVTSSGSLTATLANQTSNTVFASPANGSSGAPTFRTLSGADISNFSSKIDASTIGQASGIVPLDASKTIDPKYLPSSVTGAVTYKGTYNATTGNSPTLPALAGSQGFYYVVNVAGTIPMALNSGDWVISNGTTWDRVANGGTVSSVFTRTGAVVAVSGDYTTDQVTEGAKKYYSDALVNANATVIGKEDLTNKVNVIAADATFKKYPTVDAIKSYVDAKVPTTGGNGQVLTVVSGSPAWSTPGGGSGTVTSVGVTLPAIFSNTTPTITTNGTMAITLNSAAQATVFAGPSGSAGVPSFRALVKTDIPQLDQNTTGTAGSATTAVTVTAAAQPNITSVGTLTGLTVTGSITGSITGTAAIATATTITNDNATAAIVYPTWVTAISGNMPPKVSSTKLSFFPSTGALTATSFIGNLNAANLTAGIVPTARLGTGTADATTYLRGDGSWQTAAGGGGDMVLATAQTVTGVKTFNNSTLAIKGTGAGITTLSTANASATGYTLTLPAATGTVALTSDIIAAPTTSAQLATQITDETGTAGKLVFSTSPILTTPTIGDATATSVTASGILQGTQLKSTIVTGTAPFTVVSATPVSGLSIGGNAMTSSNILGGVAGQVLYQSGSGATSMVPVGTSGQVLTSTGSGAPTWSNAAAGGGLPVSTTTDAGKVLTVNSGGAAAWSAPSGGGGSGLIVYHPAAPTVTSGVTFLCRATGPGVTVTQGANLWTFNVNVPAGVFLSYLKIFAIYTFFGNATLTDMYITTNQADKLWNNDESDAIYPTVECVDFTIATPMYVQSYDTNNATTWYVKVSALGNGSMTTWISTINKHKGNLGFYTTMRF